VTSAPLPPDQPLVRWHEHSVQRQRGCVVWFTGLSGSGKSTIANAVDSLLAERGVPSYLLDGDNVRHGLNAGPDRLATEYGESFARRFGLTFAAEDRQENIRRIGCVAELFCNAGLITLTAFVSPYRGDRDRVRRIVCGSAGTASDSACPGDFLEVFVDTPLEVCERRDPKGLYQLARSGKLKGMTGIDDPYEPPLHPELVLAGGQRPVAELAAEVLCLLEQAGKIRAV
jgi:adenylylsulfate kinase